MKTLYVHKTTGVILQYPTPKDINNYHIASVPDDFDCTIYTKYDPIIKSFSTVVDDKVNKQLKLDEISGWTQSQLDSATIVYNDNVYDADIKSRDTMTAMINAKYDVSVWTTADNKKSKITLDDLVGILHSVIDLHQKIHDRQRLMKDEVLLLTGSDVTNYKVQW